MASDAEIVAAVRAYVRWIDSYFPDAVDDELRAALRGIPPAAASEPCEFCGDGPCPNGCGEAGDE